MLRHLSDRGILAAIIVLALAFRAVGLNQPLWYDEILTLYTHLKLPLNEMMDSYEMNHHYLYSFQAKFFMSLFGDAPWVVRLPALLFGLASIWVVWVLVRDAVGATYAHITAILLAVSYHHIWFSQNARGYTELMFWSMLGTLLFIRGLDRPRARIWCYYAFTLAMAVFTHLTGLFFFIAHGIVWLGWLVHRQFTGSLKQRDFIWPAFAFVVGLVLTALLYLPVIPGVIENAQSVGETSGVDRMVEYQNPVWTILEAIRTIAGNLGPLIGAVALVVIALCVLGATRIRPLFWLVALTHILLTMAILLALGMRIWPRFFFVDIGMLLSLIVLGVAAFAGLAGRILPQVGERTFFRLATAAMVIVSLGLAARNYSAPKQNIPGPQALIAQEAAAGDKIHAVGWVANVYTEHLKTGWSNIKTGEDLNSALTSGDTHWLVVGFPARSFRAVDGLEDAVESFELIKRFPGTLGDGAMLVYRRQK